MWSVEWDVKPYYLTITSSSAVAKKWRNALCLSVVSFNSTIPRVQFLSRVSILTHDINILQICPSFCQSVTFWYWMKMA